VTQLLTVSSLHNLVSVAISIETILINVKGWLLYNFKVLLHVDYDRHISIIITYQINIFAMLCI